MRLVKAIAFGVFGTAFFLACSLLGVAMSAGLAALMGPWSIFVWIAAIFAGVVAVTYADDKPC